MQKNASQSSTNTFLKPLKLHSLIWTLIMWTKPSMSLKISTGHGSILNFNKIDMKFARKSVQKFLLPHISVTLNEHQGHSNWYKATQLSGLYHHTKFERSQSVNAKCKPRLFVFFLQNHWSWILPWLVRRDKLEMEFIITKRLNSCPNPNHIHWNL